MRTNGIFSINPLTVFGFILMLSAQVASAADTQHLLPPQQGDLIAEHLSTATPAQPVANTRREEVRFSWPLASNQNLAPSQSPHQAQSRLYWFEADGNALSKGIPIEVSATQAVVRISPLAQAADKSNVQGPPLNPTMLELTQGAKSLRSQAAMEAIAGQEQLAASGSPFPPGTTAFRLARDLGAGAFQLRTNQPIPAKAHYLVEVVDQHSDAVMTLQTDSASYLHGRQLHATLALKTNQGQSIINSADAYLLSPDGERYPVAITKADNSAYAADIILEQEAAQGQGLWELHALLQGKVDGAPVRRNAKTAFALVTPHARLPGQVQISRNEAGDLTTTLATEITSAGRYAMRGVLYGSDANGSMKPIAVSETARWLEIGKSQITLVFNAEDLQGSGLKAPYELRDLQLSDQGRMAVQHRQQRALLIN
jgi:hypothetical protein